MSEIRTRFRLCGCGHLDGETILVAVGDRYSGILRFIGSGQPRASRTKCDGRRVAGAAPPNSLRRVGASRLVMALGETVSSRCAVLGNALVFRHSLPNPKPLGQLAVEPVFLWRPGLSRRRAESGQRNRRA